MVRGYHTLEDAKDWELMCRFMVVPYWTDALGKNKRA
jgi:hypothetical protein